MSEYIQNHHGGVCVTKKIKTTAETTNPRGNIGSVKVTDSEPGVKTLQSNSIKFNTITPRPPVSDSPVTVQSQEVTFSTLISQRSL